MREKFFFYANNFVLHINRKQTDGLCTAHHWAHTHRTNIGEPWQTPHYFLLLWKVVHNGLLFRMWLRSHCWAFRRPSCHPLNAGLSAFCIGLMSCKRESSVWLAVVARPNWFESVYLTGSAACQLTCPGKFAIATTQNIKSMWTAPSGCIVGFIWTCTTACFYHPPNESIALLL